MSPRNRWRFAGFEMDLVTATLLKDSVPVHICQQPFRALALLVTRSGQMVTREELREEIWGERAQARAAAARALAVDPMGAEALVAAAEVKYRLDHDYLGADELFVRGLDLGQPSNFTRERYGLFLQLQGR